jgi:hypothetical protein
MREIGRAKFALVVCRLPPASQIKKERSSYHSIAWNHSAAIQISTTLFFAGET